MSTKQATKVSRPFARRTLLQAGGVGALATLSLSACGGTDNGGDSNGSGSGNGNGASEPGQDRPLESPVLAEQVEAGDLPPLEERLPVEGDRLVVAMEEYGVYGGTYQGAVQGQGDDAWLRRMIGYEPELRPDRDLLELGQPGILKGLDSNEEGTEFTLHLREGMKWSDGEPVTADDVMFAIEEVYFNTDLRSLPPVNLSIDEEPCEAEKIDDFTVQLTFPAPKGGLEDLFTRILEGNGSLFYYPKHYFEQFMPHLNDEAESIVEEAGYSDWISLWEDRMVWWNNPEKPVLHPWILSEPLNAATVVTMDRNPYYWKVDEEGAQLPFIDRMEFEVVQDEEVMLLSAINGEIDFHARHFNSDQNRAVLADAQESGDFRFVAVDTTLMNRMVISLNLNHEDEVLREIFQNKDFRIGLSHAIDRQDIIDTAFQRQGEPWQAAPHPESEYVDEEFGKQYTEYDVDLANEYLDNAGYSERDSSGYRLRPDGDRIRIIIDMAPFFPEWPPAVDMVTQMWAEVGIDASVNPMERTLLYDRKHASANQHDAAVWAGDGGPRLETIATQYHFPSNSLHTDYAPKWANWFQTRGEGEFAEEPPEEVKRQMELFWAMDSEPDSEARADLFRELLEISKEQFYCIGISYPIQGYGIAKNDLHNVQDHFDAWNYGGPGSVDPCSWFFDRESS